MSKLGSAYACLGNMLAGSICPVTLEQPNSLNTSFFEAMGYSAPALDAQSSRENQRERIEKEMKRAIDSLKRTGMILDEKSMPSILSNCGHTDSFSRFGFVPLSHLSFGLPSIVAVPVNALLGSKYLFVSEKREETIKIPKPKK